MTERMWSVKDLGRFLRFEDPEVRCWAADRLMRHHPKEATELIGPFLFDDHGTTQEMVAAHLAHHGGRKHLEQLAKGLRHLRGLPAARSLKALVELRAPEAVELVRSALNRRDFDEECWAYVLESLAGRGDPGAREVLREFLQRRTDWFGSPPILRSALQHAQPGEYRPLLKAWLRSLQWRDAGMKGASGEGVAEAFRVLMDHLQIDDCGWCLRTSLSGRIDFSKTIKAVESSYDCELQPGLDAKTVERIATALREGAFEAIAAVVAETVRQGALKVKRLPGDDLADRIVEVVSFWSDREVAQAVEGLGPYLGEWLIGFLLSAAVKMARYRNYHLEVRRAADDPAALLSLMEVETSALLDPLPVALRRAVDKAGPEGSDRRSAARRAVEERCLEILAARGPFFPQSTALETLGEIRSAGAIGEIIEFLSEDNSYLYEAAEHALSQIGEAIVEPVSDSLEADELDEEAEHSLLILLCELGTKEALGVVLEQFDRFVEAAGPGNAARWMSLFGARELIDPLRRYLQLDVPQVGNALLLLGGIHNVRLPEDAAIRRAIDDYWKQRPEEGGDGGEPDADDGSDRYLM
jgi:HEAT repeat protein